MDNLNNNNRIDIYKDTQLMDSVFVKDNNLEFIFKKTERIATAMYLITNFFVREEPLKWSLRNSSTTVLNKILTFTTSELRDQEKTLHDIHTEILKLISNFNLSYHSGFVTQMNYDILISEINNVVSVITNYTLQIQSTNRSLFKDNYFDIGQIEREDEAHDSDNQSINHSNSQNLYSNFYQRNVLNNRIKDNRNDVINRTKVAVNVSKNDSIKPNNNLKDKKPISTRRLKIMTEVKRLGDVSIKDIATILPDLSAKTLQRELLGMVADEILIKTGERRWSRYSLK